MMGKDGRDCWRCNGESGLLHTDAAAGERAYYLVADFRQEESAQYAQSVVLRTDHIRDICRRSAGWGRSHTAACSGSPCCASRKLLFGLVLGYVTTLFFSLVQTAGQVMDMQMGFGMVNVFDVQSNISVPVTGNLLNVVIADHILWCQRTPEVDLYHPVHLFAYTGRQRNAESGHRDDGSRGICAGVCAGGERSDAADCGGSAG